MRPLVAAVALTVQTGCIGESYRELYIHRFEAPASATVNMPVEIRLITNRDGCGQPDSRVTIAVDDSARRVEFAVVGRREIKLFGDFLGETCPFYPMENTVTAGFTPRSTGSYTLAEKTGRVSAQVVVQ